MKLQLLIFSTSSCRACKPYIANVLTAISDADLENDVIVEIVSPDMAKLHGVYEVSSVPMTYLKQGDRIVECITGVTSPDKILDAIERLLDE